MIDVAASVGKDPLPESFRIGPDHLQEALDKQGVDIDPLDVVLVRTGTGGVWLKGDGVGANEKEIEGPDLAGITVEGAKWLVEKKGALAIGTDTSAVEVASAQGSARRRHQLQPGPRLPARATGRPHPGIPEPGGPGEGQGLQVRLHPGCKQDPGRLSRHGAPFCRDRLRAGFSSRLEKPLAGAALQLAEPVAEILGQRLRRRPDCRGRKGAIVRSVRPGREATPQAANLAP
jgi:hypothetical protein